jgi:hypothetical protein
MKSKFLLAACAALCVPAVAVAAVPWDDPDGEALSFFWENGQNSDTNLFGSPNNYGDDNLYFLNSDFVAFANDGNTWDEATDTMDVDFIAKPTLKFKSVQVFEFGDYNILGGDGNSVSAQLDMAGIVAGHPESPFTDGFLFSAAEDTTGSVPWDSEASLIMEFAVPEITDVHLTVSNTLVAMSDGVGGTASITGNFVLLGISVVVIPEPGSLAFLAIGGLALVRRRR